MMPTRSSLLWIDSLSRREKLAWTAFAIVASLTLANLLFNLIAYTIGLTFPYSTYLFDPIDNFGDFFGWLYSYPGGEVMRLADRQGLHALMPIDPPSMADGRQRLVANLHMTPLDTVIAQALLLLARTIDPMLLFLVLLTALAGYGMLIAAKAGITARERVGWGLLAFSTYPAAMTVVRGNLLAGLASLLIIHATLLGLRRRAALLAVALLAIAVNIRPNAILFVGPLILFFWKQKWSVGAAFALAVGAIGLISLRAAHALYPPYDWQSFKTAIAVFYRWYAVYFWGLGYGSSLFGALKILIGYRAALDSGTVMLSLAIAGSACLLRLFDRIGDATAIFLVAAACCLGTNVLGDYHLLMLWIVPIALAWDEPGPADRIMLVTACLLMAPKNYVFLEPHWMHISVQVVLNPLILLVGAVATLATAVDWRRSITIAQVRYRAA